MKISVANRAESHDCYDEDPLCNTRFERIRRQEAPLSKPMHRKRPIAPDPIDPEVLRVIRDRRHEAAHSIALALLAHTEDQDA